MLSLSVTGSDETENGGLLWWQLWRIVHYMRRSWTMLSVFKFIVLLGACATALLYYLSLDWPVLVEDESYGIVAMQGQQMRYLIESERCSDVTANCYIVYDAVDLLTSDMNRYLIMQNLHGGCETIVRLIPPKGIKSIESDSRFWQVDHTQIKSQYLAVMITAPFGASALALPNTMNNTANVLIVGLGGGSMNMFLSNYFPKMKITIIELDPVVIELAWRWFGLNKTITNVHTMDGIKFIENAAARKESFDVVMIDICSKNGVLACPSGPFIRPNFIKNLKRIIKSSGVVVLNISPQRDDVSVVDEVVRKFQDEFPACAVTRLTQDVNTVLLCQLVEQVDPENSQRLMSHHFQEAWQYFGFDRQFGAMKMSFNINDSKVGNNI